MGVEASGLSRHKCLVYDGPPSAQLPVVVPLLLDGLKDNWRCLYLGSPESVQMVDAAIAAKGVDTERERQRGALLFSSDRGHLESGAFDPTAMVSALCTFVDDAVREGFEGLCATGDMKWELGDDRNFDRLLEYEARLERVFREKPLRGICQYHSDLLPPRALRDALLTHRTAYLGEELNRDNLFYVPPELLLGGDEAAAEKQGEWMCRQILRVLKAERARDQAIEQLAELNRDLERRVAQRTAELQVANRHLEAFSYSVSHDLRAPLRAITGFAQALAEDCGDALGGTARQHLDRVRTGARQMGDLIDGMLGLARVVKADLRHEAVDLSAIAGEIAHGLRDRDPARAAEIVVQPGLRAVGDEALLRAVLTNLLENAWKFTAKRGRARVEVGRHGEEAGMPVFFVRDDGAGFDMRFADRLFGAFQRLHQQADFPGIGVGLATVERIVSRHGGRVWAEGKPDGGATFFFTLPATREDLSHERGR